MIMNLVRVCNGNHMHSFFFFEKGNKKTTQQNIALLHYFLNHDKSFIKLVIKYDKKLLHCVLGHQCTGSGPVVAQYQLLRSNAIDDHI